MNRLIALTFFVLLCYTAYGIEAVGESLYVKVLITKAPTITLNSADLVCFSDEDLIIQRHFRGKISLSLDNDSSKEAFILFRTHPRNSLNAFPDTSDIIQTFKWNDGFLYCTEQYRELLPTRYSSSEEARQASLSLNLPTTNIITTFAEKPSLKIDCMGETYYLQLPVYLRSTTPIKINDDKGLYHGDFVLTNSGAQLCIANRVELNDYVRGVLPSEIGNSAPLEVLKAQSIAARTHALSLVLYNRHQDDNADLCATTHCQVFRGDLDVDLNVIQAVQDTRDMVLCYNSNLADTPYHSSCGGKTDASSVIWNGRPIPYLMGVTCISATDSLDLSNETQALAWISYSDDTEGMQSWEKSATYWERTITLSQIAENSGLSSIQNIEVLKRSTSGRIVKLRISGNKSIDYNSESAIRKVFGGLPSSLFCLSSSDLSSLRSTSKITIRGKGSGHGVGMCQIGALKLGRSGADYYAILQRYYPLTNIQPIRIQYAQ